MCCMASHASAQGFARTFNVNGVSFNMMAVGGGSFIMGANHDDQAYEDEKPSHEVVLDNYYIGETEVTQGLWYAVMGSCPAFNLGDEKPVDGASRDDCLEFIARLNVLTGMQFRLPTEAEWEYAARGGRASQGNIFSGSSRIEDVGWSDSNSGNATHDVKSKSPNELGVYDMSGNVWEWCSGYKGKYSSSKETNPKGPASGFFVVYRGGSALVPSRRCRVSARYADASDFKGNCNGMRLCLDGDNVLTAMFEVKAPQPAEEVKPAVQEPVAKADPATTPKPKAESKPKSSDNVVTIPAPVSIKESPVTVIADTMAVAPEEVASTVAVFRHPKNRTCSVNGVKFNMVYVEPGEFMMGATPEQTDFDADQTPAHLVKISNAYFMGETEVTQELWQAVMGNNPSTYNDNLQLPVETVSWDDCQRFIKRLNALTGLTFRLPTEAEWEYAARGGNRTEVNQYSGSYELDVVAWYGENSEGFTKEVKTKAPNELGLYDMSGNVWEWCNDWFRFYSPDAVTDPKGPETGYFKVFRGGSWSYPARNCTTSFRCSEDVTAKNLNIGFRLAM